MTRSELNEILSKIKTHKKRLMIYIKNHHPEVYNSIFEQTQFLDKTATFAERIYCIKNNLYHRPICPVCHVNEVSFAKDKGKYRTACSQHCSRKDKNRIQKCIDTYNNKTKEEQQKIFDKVLKTKIERYGEDWYEKSFAEKARQTKLIRYGNPNYFNKEKLKETFTKKYGGPSPFSCKEIIEKSKQTCLSNYGVDNFGKTPESIKIRTMGTRNRSFDYIMNYQLASPMFTREEYINGNHEDQFEFSCKKCGTSFYSRWDNGGLVTPCPHCHPIKYGTSNMETEIIDFIKTIYNGTIKRNVRDLIAPKELDIVLPGKKIAIELDGVFFHSDYYKQNSSYHLEKTKDCEQLGYQLIHVFEDEWVFKQQIVKDRIRHLLGASSKKIYARKCKLVELKYSDTELFLRLNHIQGSIKTNINLGLMYNDELVSAMTISKPRFTKKYQYELIRFCSKIDCNVIGAAGKLFHYFVNKYNPSSVISYADYRYSTGKLYEKLNFKNIGRSNPDYFYLKPPDIHRHSRLEFQKHKLRDKLNTFDEKLSEYQNMRANGYYRIYDCGNLIYLYER